MDKEVHDAHSRVLFAVGHRRTGKPWSSVMPNEQGDAKWHLASNARFSGAREQFDSETTGKAWSSVMPHKQGDAK
jgi:hypothetical protein